MSTQQYLARKKATVDTIFRPYGPGSSAGWQIWQKPQNASMVWVIAYGGGGSGAGGQTAAAGVARTGGGGGGSSSIFKVMFPAHCLPDCLYVLVGIGGAAPAGNAAGNAGTLSYVSRLPVTTAAELYAISGNAAAGGGAVATTAGAAGTAYTSTSNILGHLGIRDGNIGIIGATGGANTGAAGTAAPWGTVLPLSGGAGGGGTPIANTNFAGGAITGRGMIPTIAGGTAAGGRGSNGFSYEDFLLFTGGSGGGTNGAAGVGGAGGDGATGCGGGGGGGGVTGGAGGRGGDGLVIFSCW